MSASAEKQISQQLPNKKQQRKKALLLLTAIFIVVGITYFIYWFLVSRHYQQTDNAYVAGNQIQIMSQVPGSVISVNFENTDLVKNGDVLVILDPTDTEQTLEQAKTALANSVRQTHQLIINSKQYQANIELRKTELKKAQNDLKRREILGTANAIGREEVQHAYDAVQAATATLDIAQQQYNANQALILTTSLEKQPVVEQAAIQVRDAWLALQRTKIVSPIDGYVSLRNVQIGAKITSGTPLMVVIPINELWIDANFKETQLAKMRIGQPATVVTDLYGEDVIYQGKIIGLNMGTGSAFSLLPAQNATGNWIKVVQRLPVRIELNTQQLAEHPLRIGLSTLVKVDTANQDGQVLANNVRTKPVFASNALSLDLAPVNQMISHIIHANAS